MRQKVVAGNWKMNTLLHEGLDLAKAVEGASNNSDSNVEIIIAPPFTHLAKVKEVISYVKLAAQNCSDMDKGAYTGEVSPEMLQSAGVEYVIIGHSERRSYYHEDDSFLNRKVRLSLAKGLSPIFCCGELLEERENNDHFNVIRKQITVGLENVNSVEMEHVIIAYEPVWAIGTGVTASPGQAQEMHQYIRGLLAELFSMKVADSTTILYGGSCNPANARELFSNPDVDGGLIGGASLKADDFMKIVNSF
jgi:triosephosphate isomerase (TIM)